MSVKPMEARAWSLLLTLALVWGFSFFFMGVAVKEIPPLTLAFLRVSLAALALWLYVWARGLEFPRGAGLWGALLMMGLLNNAIPFSLIMWGQLSVESGLAAIFNATTPVFTVFVAHMLTADEKASAHRVIGVLIALLGAALIIGVEALSGFDIRNLGQLAIIAAAVSYAFAAVWGRRLSALPRPVAAAGMLSGSSLWLAPLALMAGMERAPSPGVIASVLGLALICTALAYLLYFAVLAQAGAGNLSLVTIFAAPVSMLLGWLFLGEQFGPAAFAGLGLIALGVLIMDGRFSFFRRAPSP